MLKLNQFYIYGGGMRQLNTPKKKIYEQIRLHLLDNFNIFVYLLIIDYMVVVGRGMGKVRKLKRKKRVNFPIEIFICLGIVFLNLYVE